MADKTQILVELLLKAQSDIGKVVDTAVGSVGRIGPEAAKAGKAASDGLRAAEAAAVAAANKIKQAQQEAIRYIADSRTKDLQKTAAGLRTLESEFIGQYKNIGLSAAQMESLRAAKAKETNAAIKRLEADSFKAGKVTTDGFNKATQAAGGLGSALSGIKTGLAGLASGIAVGGIAAAIVSVASSLDSLRDKATALSIPVDQLAGLEFAATQSDASVEDLAVAIRSLSNVIADSVGGSESASKALERLGLDARALANMPVKEALLATFEAINKMPAGVERNAAAMDVLGRSYQSLLPLIKEGTSGINALMAEQQRLNPTTQAMADAADDAFDAWGRLKESAKGLGLAMAQLASDAGIVSFFDNVATAASGASSAIRGVRDAVASQVKSGQELVGSLAALRASGGQSAAAVGNITNRTLENAKKAALVISILRAGGIVPQDFKAVVPRSASESPVLYEDSIAKTQREAREKAEKESASKSEAIATAAANKIKQAQEDAIKYVANVREQDLEKSVAGLRTLEAEFLKQYENIGLSAAQFEALRVAKAAETNAAIKEIETDRLKAFADAEKQAEEATTRRYEKQIELVKKAAQAQTESIDRAAELAELRLGIKQDLGQVSGARAEQEAHAQAMANLREKMAVQQELLAKTPGGAVGDATRAEAQQAILALEQQATMETEKHNAAMVRLGSSTASWAAGAKTAFADFMSQHSAFNTAAAAMRSAIDGIAGATTSFVMGIVDGTKRGKDAFKDFAKNLLKMLAEILVKALMTAAVMALIGIVFPGGGALMAGGGIASSIAGGAASAGTSAAISKSAGPSGGASIMPMPGGKPSMGVSAGAAKSGDTYNVYQIQAIEPQTFASFLQQRESQDVLSGTMARNLSGNTRVRNAARG